MNLKAIGGRRFLLTAVFGLLATALCWFGKIDGAIYATVIIATVGAFIGGNVVEAMKAAPK